MNTLAPAPGPNPFVAATRPATAVATNTAAAPDAAPPAWLYRSEAFAEDLPATAPALRLPWPLARCQRAVAPFSSSISRWAW